MPIRHSQVANIGMEKAGVSTPKVRTEIVSEAMVSAVLTPGKNLTTPNHINMHPSDILKIVIPFLAFHSITSISFRLILSIIINDFQVVTDIYVIKIFPDLVKTILGHF